MVEVSIEVRNGTTRFEIAVRAESLRRAVNLVEERYPGSEVGAKLPIEPESFFEAPAATAGLVEVAPPERMAA